MDNTVSIVRRGKRYSLTARILFVLTVLLLALSTSGCTGPPDPTLPAEYYGTSWACSNPDAIFEVDDTGSCIGTLVFKSTHLPIRVDLIRGTRTSSIFVIEEDRYVCIFHGTYEIIGNCIVLKGEWNEFLEKIYHQPYDPGECTLIFERRQ